jgi:predicted DCC family thiol-disulfide oxidoreductase YuxK
MRRNTADSPALFALGSDFLVLIEPAIKMSTINSVMQTPFPSLADRPSAHLVIYDGNCGFCQHQMRRLQRWDRDGQLAYLSLHDPLVKQRWPDLSADDLMREICLVTPGGDRFHGADAFKCIARELPRLWPMSAAMSIPFSMPLWRFLYRQFAKRRYRLSEKYACDDNACEAHL